MTYKLPIMTSLWKKGFESHITDVDPTAIAVDEYILTLAVSHHFWNHRLLDILTNGELQLIVSFFHGYPNHKNSLVYTFWTVWEIFDNRPVRATAKFIGVQKLTNFHDLPIIDPASIFLATT